MTTAEARERFLNEMRYGQGDEVKLNALDALIAAVRAEERANIVKALREADLTEVSYFSDDRDALMAAADFVESLDRGEG